MSNKNDLQENIFSKAKRFVRKASGKQRKDVISSVEKAMSKRRSELGVKPRGSRLTTDERKKMDKDTRSRDLAARMIDAKYAGMSDEDGSKIGTDRNRLGVMKENYTPVSSAIDALLEKNLEAMRENINRALAEKAAEALEERKVQLASSYFEIK